MTALVKKKLISESVRLGQIFAVDHYIDCGYEDSRPNQLVFEQLASMDFEEAEVSPAGDYEFDDEAHVYDRMTTMAKDVQNTIDAFEDSAMKGLKLAMISGQHFFDYESFNFRKLAVLGSLLNVTVEVNSVMYKLDEATAKWYCISYPIQTAEIDFGDGAEFMPKIEGEKTVYIGSDRELRIFPYREHPLLRSVNTEFSRSVNTFAVRQNSVFTLRKI